MEETTVIHRFVLGLLDDFVTSRLPPTLFPVLWFLDPAALTRDTVLAHPPGPVLHCRYFHLA